MRRKRIHNHKQCSIARKKKDKGERVKMRRRRPENRGESRERKKERKKERKVRMRNKPNLKRNQFQRNPLPPHFQLNSTISQRRRN